jgi:DNA-binding PadR family transcriptional regulator
MSKSNLLIDETPIVFQPTLAKLVGLHEAIVLQTLRYWCGNKKSGKVVDGERWIFNTLEQWREFSFPFWSARTIGELFRTLESMGLVKSKQFDLQDGKAMKYYTVTDAALNILTSERADHLEDSSTPIWNFLPDHVEDSSRSARARHIKQYTEKQTEKQEPLAPLQGEVENSPMGSSSTSGELELAYASKGATAQGSESDDSCSRPPHNEKANKVRGSRKSPPVVKPPKVSDATWEAFLQHRKNKRAEVTQTVIDRFQSEADKANWWLEDALKESIERNWRGFEAGWVKRKKFKGPLGECPDWKLDNAGYNEWWSHIDFEQL